MLEPTVKLTQDQIDFFNREGYLSITAITTQEEVAKIRAIYDALFASRAGHKEGMHFDLAGTDEEGKEAALPQILSPSKYAPELTETLYRANALAIAAQLLEGSVSLRSEHAILKPGPKGPPTPWHQDEAYWDPSSIANTVSAWMPLQEATLENGCMQFIPGSHKGEILPHHSMNHNPRIVALETDLEYVDVARAVACPLPPGGATFHSSRTLHHTSANRTANPRRAYTLDCGTAPTKLAQPRDFYWQNRQTARDERSQEVAKSS